MYPSQSPPSAPCRTPTTFITSLLTSPLNLSGATPCSPRHISRDRVDEAPIHVDEAPIHVNGSRTADDDLSNATGNTRRSEMMSQQQQEPGEGPDDLPPIAFLRDQSQSVSPAFSVRRVSSPIGRGTNAVSGTGRDDVAKSSARTSDRVYQPSFNKFAATPQPTSASATQTRASSTFKFRFNNDYPALALPPSTASKRVAPIRPPSVPRHVPHRRKNDGYTYDSLMRRPAAPERHNDHGAPAGQREFEAACETEPAGVGTLHGPPALELGNVVALADGGSSSMGVGQETRWVQPRANSAPTAAYAALLEDAFGPGSVLRGEGAKPLDSLRRRKVLGRPKKGRSGSATTEQSARSSSGVEMMGMDVDTDESASVDLGTDGGASRVHEWIAEIEMVVKGKRKLVREDLRSLADTMREIADMPAAEGRALGDDGPRLRKSIWQLAQLEDIPFRDEYKVRGWARRLLKHWPAI
ncbi:hypothetical protein B0H13DRAFT_2303113 [Mycena leptocephala]|nr:hypothetical protein B0H13DRAFT_2303113 [Mycena leptocephala]